MPLRFHVVGSIQVSTGRRVIGESELHGPQGRLVLAMLVTEHRRRVGRDELAEELWPDTVPAAWDTAVRVIVSKLRAALRPILPPSLELIESANGGYQVRLPAAGSVDLDEAGAAVHEAEARLAAGSVDAAGADALVASMITTRPFLPDAAGPWATATRERVGEIRLRSLMVLGEVWLAKGDYGQSARDARSVLRLDPYRESAHRLLMRTYSAAGDRAAAAHAYRSCRELLTTELGVDPAPETIDLARSLGLSDPSPGSVDARTSQPPPLPSGRPGERRRQSTGADQTRGRHGMPDRS